MDRKDRIGRMLVHSSGGGTITSRGNLGHVSVCGTYLTGPFCLTEYITLVDFL